MKNLFLFLLAFSFSVTSVTAPLNEQKEIVHAVSSLEKVTYERSDLDIQLSVDKEQQVREILAEFPESLVIQVKRIIGETGDVKRGLASFRSIYLGVDKIESDEEFRRVFIHELGHTVDLGALKAFERKEDSGFKDGSNTIYETDPSLDFYRLCWSSEYKPNEQCSELDFVSGYAASDAFEDFTESFLLFVENNKSFKELAKNSEILTQKYNFFQNVVFNEKEQNEGGLVDLPQNERVWDLTKVL